ncbi:MAG: tRNA uracil 4-sulfurtransferase ThiI [Planctomycetota bacterium]
MTDSFTLLIRYGELGLKGGNRHIFENALCHNLKAALGPLPGLKTQRVRGRILVHADVPLEDHVERAAQVFGVTSASPVISVYLDHDLMVKAAMEQLDRSMAEDFPGQDKIPFRVTVNRSNKSFPYRSRAMVLTLADLALTKYDALQVNLKHAELELEVDIREEQALIFARRIQGPGGLPVGTLGRGMTLLSGGIDSPVAAWMGMKRGLRMEFISFYSFPHTGPQSREKIIRLAEKLGEWQPRTVLHIVPFAAYQEAIRDYCPPAYRTVLYRRAMTRIACRLSARRKCKALITGESLGQVASQTLQNIAAIEDASTLPILRPLIGMDKIEAIARAREIGTFDLSILPAPDCCTVFQPDSPVLFATREEARAAEAVLDLDKLTLDAIHGAEKLELSQDA